MPLYSLDRHRALLPDRVLKPLAELLVHLDELVDAIGGHLLDSRWGDGAKKLRAALDALRAPTEDELALRVAIARHESARVDAENARLAQLEAERVARWRESLIAESTRAHARENAEKAMPRVIRGLRKGQAVVRALKRRA